MSTHCDYKISRIRAEGNKCTFEYTFYEGHYGFVTDEDGNQTEEYIRDKLIGKGEKTFDWEPVSMDSMKIYMREEIEKVRGERILIPECEL